jgi:hypothetical protein
MITQQKLIDLVILMLSLYFLAGGIFNIDQVLRLKNTPDGIPRMIVRIIATGAGLILLVGAVVDLSK